MTVRTGVARVRRIGAGPVAPRCVAAAFALVLAASPAGPSRADATVDMDDATSDETLLEEDFTALDLFESMRMLRPRVRLLENATLGQDFGRADVDALESGLRSSVVAPLSPALAVRVVGELRGTYVDFHGDDAFLDTNRAGAPFDSLLSAQLAAEGRYEVLDDWALVAGVELSSGWEEGSRFARGLQQGGFVGVAHLFLDRLSILAGVGLRSRMGRGGASVSPVIQLGWRVTDDVEIETQGLGLNVAYRVDRDLTLFARGGLQNEAYRLGGRGGEVGHGILRHRTLPLLVGGRWRIAERWRFRAAAGAMLYQRYGVYEHGDHFYDASSSRKPAFTGHVDVEYRF